MLKFSTRLVYGNFLYFIFLGSWEASLRLNIIVFFFYKSNTVSHQSVDMGVRTVNYWANPRMPRGPEESSGKLHQWWWRWPGSAVYSSTNSSASTRSKLHRTQRFIWKHVVGKVPGIHKKFVKLFSKVKFIHRLKSINAKIKEASKSATVRSSMKHKYNDIKCYLNLRRFIWNKVFDHDLNLLL